MALSKNLGAKKRQKFAIFGPFLGRKSRPIRLKTPPFCPKKSFDALKFYKTVFNQLGKHILILCLVYFGQKATILEPFPYPRYERGKRHILGLRCPPLPNPLGHILGSAIFWGTGVRCPSPTNPFGHITGNPTFFKK